VDPGAVALTRQSYEVQARARELYPNDAAARDKYVADWRQANPVPRGTIATVADHVDHIVKVAGIDHVGIGSDYDGISMLPKQLEDVSTYPYITQALLDRGYTPEQIKKVLGENLLRVMRGAEATAKRLQGK
jgi:membrane dipeptidase